MNTDRLDSLINSYIDNFDMVNNEVHDENMKWKAIHHFKNNFDIDAPNFYDMFKYAMSESKIIINNGTKQPINGILRLISHEEDTMRGLFAKLYEDDGGDLDKRQNRIEHFVTETNKLLDKYERGKWKLEQDFRSALSYLTFYKPEENYFYKSSQCKPFFRFLEYGEEIGSGQYFKLSRYYRMCDEVRAYLANHSELMNKHNTRWSVVDNPGDDLHILTFDLIYCSISYSFYESEKYKKVVHKSKDDLIQEKLEADIETKRIELEALEAQLESAQQILDAIPEIFIEGQTVKHKMFGQGRVVKQNGTYIEVQFAARTSTFILTMAFISGFLSSEDTTIMERCKLLEDSLAQLRKVTQLIHSKQTEIESLMAKLQ